MLTFIVLKWSGVVVFSVLTCSFQMNFVGVGVYASVMWKCSSGYLYYNISAVRNINCVQDLLLYITTVENNNVQLVL